MLKTNFYFKYSLVLFALTFFLTDSFAEIKWKKIAQNKSGSVFYIDTSSIKRVGDTAFFYMLTDYARPNSVGNLSSAIYVEVQCSTSRFRYLRDSYYDQPMGNGRVASTITKSSEWTYANQKSVGRRVNNFACKNTNRDINWKKITVNTSGSVYYIDTSSIKRIGDTVFFFRMTDYARPNSQGNLSSKIYMEVKCSSLRYRYLKDSYYNQPKGNGKPDTIINTPGKWKYYSNTKSVGAIVSNYACRSSD